MQLTTSSVYPTAYKASMIDSLSWSARTDSFLCKINNSLGLLSNKVHRLHHVQNWNGTHSNKREIKSKPDQKKKKKGFSIYVQPFKCKHIQLNFNFALHCRIVLTEWKRLLWDMWFPSIYTYRHLKGFLNLLFSPRLSVSVLLFCFCCLTVV